ELAAVVVDDRDLVLVPLGRLGGLGFELVQRVEALHQGVTPIDDLVIGEPAGKNLRESLVHVSPRRHVKAGWWAVSRDTARWCQNGISSRPPISSPGVAMSGSKSGGGAAWAGACLCAGIGAGRAGAGRAACCDGSPMARDTAMTVPRSLSAMARRFSSLSGVLKVKVPRGRLTKRM